MTHLPLGTAPDLPLLLAAGASAALALVGATRNARRRRPHPQKRPGGPAVRVAALAALGCTAYSADTSWRFAADYLDMAGTAERAGMFAAAELALFSTALMARQNLAAQGAPGLPGTLVWVITTVQVIPAYAESGPVGGTVRAFVGPVMAAMLWHLAMGIELRLRTPGAASHGLVATLGREARERLLSRLGIAARDRDAAQITRDRATTRAVALAARLAEKTPEQQQSRRGRRLTRRLSRAIGAAAVGTDPAQRALLLERLAARRHALALATVPLPSPWSPAPSSTPCAPVPAAGPRGPAEPAGDRGPGTSLGPVPGSGDASTRRAAGTGSAGTGTGPACPTDTEGSEETAPAEDLAGHGHEPRRGPTTTDTGTEPGDRGPTTTDTGTEPGDRGPTTTDTGTEPGDRGHKVPLRRKPTPKTKSKRKGKSPRQTPRPTREPEVSVDQLVEQIRPHVSALLERDGNECVTRVQLREILRREGLKGGRNDRLSLVLQQLRSDATNTTRSTAR
ncbi:MULTISPECIES: hypothetical protein [unclassified Streptomyces]|uniref:hypothetical protein n=1 Tax=unclassified Streptomyces TaxID=2593676 RepID=UPI0036312478